MKLGKTVKHGVNYNIQTNVGEIVSSTLNKNINNNKVWEFVRISMIISINPRINEIR
jgi:hypothetical protein